MFIIGIDPGLRGGVAVVAYLVGDQRPVVDMVAPMPLTADGGVDAWALHRMLFRSTQGRAELAVIERVSAAPGQGNASGFVFGQAAGIAEGVAACSAHRVERVPASVWKQSYRLPGGAAGKAQSVSLAAKLTEPRTTFATDGEAEAILLAWWGAKHKCSV